MNWRSTIVWAMLAVGLVAYVFLYERRRPDAATAAAQAARLIPNLEPAHISSLEIIRSNSVIRVERTNNNWRLVQPIVYPAQTALIEGWLQSLADGIILLAKEDLMPEGADGMLFRLAPYASFCASFCAFIALPFAFDFVGQRLNVGVFFVVAVLGLEVFGVILAGYARPRISG